MIARVRTRSRLQRTVARRSARRGVSLVVVLGLIAITLATSYALMRSEFSAVRIQHNSHRHTLARQAAMVGLSVALRKMEESGWAGANSTVDGNLSGQERYSVTYTAGDSSLDSSSPEYAEFPYRVTLISIGTSTDPGSAQSRATHKVRAVVRLIARKLASGPSDLSNIVNYTWYQTHNDDFQFKVPLSVQGKVRIQGTFDMEDYQWSSSASDRYISDLNAMRLAGQPDYRPFSGPLELSFSSNGSSLRSWLTGTLGVSLVSNSATGMSAQWNHPGSVGSYRLYPGGLSYSVPTAPSTITGPLEANVASNPLGLFYQSGPVTLGSNARLRGTLVAGGDVYITGANVSLQPVDLPAVQGSSNVVRLPTLLAADDIEVASGGDPTISGLAVTWDRFSLLERSQTKLLAMQGNLVARRFILGGRSEFDLSSTWWSIIYSAFRAQLDNPPHLRIDHFPMYVNGLGLRAEPKVTFLPPASPTTYVWPANGVTIFVPGDSDGGGLRWELVSWRDIR